MRATTGPAAKKALKALFDEATDDTTGVYRNRTNVEINLKENVFLGNIVAGTREWATMGATPSSRQISEEYGIETEVEVQYPGSDGDAAEDRIWEIVEALEETIKLNTTLDGLVQDILPAKFDLTVTPGKDGYLCLYTLEIGVKARV